MGTSRDDDNPFLLANEIVASTIGQFLRLPIPPFALMRNGSEQALFSSLHAQLEKRPDPDPTQCVKFDEHLCTGVLVFDAFIGNTDRHAGNLLVDNPDRPSKIDLIDHDRSIFGHMPDDDGASFSHETRLTDLSSKTGLLSEDWLSAKRHCFLDLITGEHLGHWFDRIESIPEWWIDDVCGSIHGLNVGKSNTDGLSKFLKLRRHNLSELFAGIKDEFTGIPSTFSWGLM